MPSNRHDRIRAVLEIYSTDDVASIVSQINAWDGSLDDQDWIEMDMWDIFGSYVGDHRDFERFVQAAADGDFNPRDNYYRWDGNYPVSCDDPDFDLDEIADWIDYHDDELERVLSDYYLEDFNGLLAEDDMGDLEEDEFFDPTDYDGVDELDEDEGEAEVKAPAEPEPATWDNGVLDALYEYTLGDVESVAGMTTAPEGAVAERAIEDIIADELEMGTFDSINRAVRRMTGLSRNSPNRQAVIDWLIDWSRRNYGHGLSNASELAEALRAYGFGILDRRHWDFGNRAWNDD